MVKKKTKLRRQRKTVINVHSVIILLNPSSLSLCWDKYLWPTLPGLPFPPASLVPSSTSDSALILPPKVGYGRGNLDHSCCLNRLAICIRGALNPCWTDCVEGATVCLFKTWSENILGHCYTPFPNGYKALLLPPFGKSDHSSILLLPVTGRGWKEKPKPTSLFIGGQTNQMPSFRTVLIMSTGRYSAPQEISVTQ